MDAHGRSQSADWRGWLQAESSRIGIRLADPQLDHFARYLGELLEWNRRANLTSITDPDEIAALHFLDSLTCLAALDFPTDARLADVGTGAGLPGIALAIARPDLRVTLIESTQKKCRFLEHVIHLLPLPNAVIQCGRAETAGRDPGLRESFDIVAIRAVARLAVAAELCLPLTRIGGAALVMKGPRAGEEVLEASPAIAILGGRIESTRNFLIPAPTGTAARTIIVLRKQTQTSPKHPRAPGKPAKRPLGIDRPTRRGIE